MSKRSRSKKNRAKAFPGHASPELVSSDSSTSLASHLAGSSSRSPPPPPYPAAGGTPSPPSSPHNPSGTQSGEGHAQKSTTPCMATTTRSDELSSDRTEHQQVDQPQTGTLDPGSGESPQAPQRPSASALTSMLRKTKRRPPHEPQAAPLAWRARRVKTLVYWENERKLKKNLNTRALILEATGLRQEFIRRMKMPRRAPWPLPYQSPRIPSSPHSGTRLQTIRHNFSVNV